jgi:DNA-directed RNA polymerase subunit N (RpoN/RPB10)
MVLFADKSVAHLQEGTEMSNFNTEVMPQICLDCGFQRTTTQEDFFMTHIKMHWELDEILDELGVEQERMEFAISFANESEES